MPSDGFGNYYFRESLSEMAEILKIFLNPSEVPPAIASGFRKGLFLGIASETLGCAAHTAGQLPKYQGSSSSTAILVAACQFWPSQVRLVLRPALPHDSSNLNLSYSHSSSSRSTITTMRQLAGNQIA